MRKRASLSERDISETTLPPKCQVGASICRGKSNCNTTQSWPFNQMQSPMTTSSFLWPTEKRLFDTVWCWSPIVSALERLFHMSEFWCRAADHPESRGWGWTGYSNVTSAAAKFPSSPDEAVLSTPRHYTVQYFIWRERQQSWTVICVVSSLTISVHHRSSPQILV